MEYSFSAVNGVSSKPSTGPLPRIKISFSLFLIWIDAFLSALLLLHLSLHFYEMHYRKITKKFPVHQTHYPIQSIYIYQNQYF